MLRAYEVHGGRIRVREQMKVIVGKALDTRTPLFDEDMRYIEFSPYWNVPPSIARGETRAAAARDPATSRARASSSWRRRPRDHGAVRRRSWTRVLRGRCASASGPGRATRWATSSSSSRTTTNIYLHHTPATPLFARERRDFSHGCIRVEEPVALAGFVLQGLPGWTEARIREAMQGADRPRCDWPHRCRC